MDDLLQRETERQRRLLQEARKAVEQEKERLRQGGARKVEPHLDEPYSNHSAAPEPRATQSPANREARQTIDEVRVNARAAPLSSRATHPTVEDMVGVRSIPDIRSALIPLDDNEDGAGWSKPFSLPRADVEPWLSFLRGYRESCLFPFAASGDYQAGRALHVDAAVQALFELKRIDLNLILDPAVQINGPVEYLDDMPANGLDGTAREAHKSQLAKAVEKGRKMGNHLYDALLGEGYVNLAQAWEKVYGRKPSVTELHSMLTTGRVKPPSEALPAGDAKTEKATQPKVQAVVVEPAPKKVVGPAAQKEEPRRQAVDALSKPLDGLTLMKRFKLGDKRKILFHLFHAVVVCAVVAVYFVIMHAIN